VARKGRPRKPGARFPSGNLRSLEDRGPEALQQRRIAALERESAARDPRTSFAWGILAARRLIATHHYLAGLSLARDWYGLYPHKTPPSCLDQFLAAGLGTIAIPPEERCVPDASGKLCGRCQACFGRRAKERYDAAEAAARSRTEAGWLMLKAALLYDEPPDFTDIDRQRRPEPFDIRERIRIPEGWDQDIRAHKALVRACEAILTVYAHPIARDKDSIEEVPVELRDGIEALRALRDERLRRARENDMSAPKSDERIICEARHERLREQRAARVKAQAEAAGVRC
jgi:hypothetical protein